ncbi:MAG: DUF3341 domain-containing protein [Planctomycetaceae bacterium]
MTPEPLYGLLAEFDDPDRLLLAARRARAEGYQRVDAYSPFPMEELADAIGFHRTRMPLVVLIGGIVGTVGGYALQYWVSVIEYPLNIGGRALHSWPAFIPVTFECAVLAASLFAVLGMLALNGLPRPHHPLFQVPQFDRATVDRFFLCIPAADAKFHPATTRQFLEDLQPIEVIDVPA